MSRVIVACQWLTFDEWLFQDDNDTLRLARVLECMIWVDRPKSRPYKDLSPIENHYCWLPIYISSFGDDIVSVYGNALQLYGAGELRHFERSQALPWQTLAYLLPLTIESDLEMDIRGDLNFYTIHNREIRDG